MIPKASRIGGWGPPVDLFLEITLQLYVNYYDQERRTDDDNPTLGLILCTDKNDAVVRYTLGPAQQNKIFASRYQLHLPTEAEIQAEIRRELDQFSLDQSNPDQSSGA